MADRGRVVDTMTTPPSHIQICHYDLGDEGNPTVFVCAHEPVFENGSPVVYDWPLDLNSLGREWVQFTTPEDLDLFIEKLQAQREWLAETDPVKRERMEEDDGSSA